MEGADKMWGEVFFMRVFVAYFVGHFVMMWVALTACGADNPWAKVAELKSGSELRIYKKGAVQAVSAVFDEVTEESLVVVVKKEQMAIAKSEIERVDARPSGKPVRKVTSEGKVKTNEPDYTPRPNAGVPVPSTTYSSGMSISGGGRPDFETVYRKR